MNYDAFMEPLTWFLTGMEKHSDECRDDLYGNSDAFIGAMKTHMRALHMSALYTSMNELSNHDHSRFLTRTNRRVGRISYAGAEAASQNINPAVMREGVVVQMTWPVRQLFIMVMRQVSVALQIRITEELIHGDMRIR